MKKINVTIWNEFRHEKTDEEVRNGVGAAGVRHQLAVDRREKEDRKIRSEGGADAAEKTREGIPEIRRIEKRYHDGSGQGSQNRGDSFVDEDG